MSAVVIDDSLVHYEVLGRGRPVILVHTWLGSWRYWVPCMQQLSANYRTYALDLWGFGDSGRNARRYDFASQVALLHDFMDRLGIAKAALVGHGLGAAVCARHARLHADRVPRLMLIAPPLFRMAAPAGTSQPTADEPPTARQFPEEAVPQPARAHQQIQTILEERAKRLGERRLAAAQAPHPQRAANPTAAPHGPAPLDDTPPPGANPLLQHLATLDRGELLRRHVDAAPEREKLRLEAAKADAAALRRSIEQFAQVDTLRDLRAVMMPTAAVYGLADTFLPTFDMTLLPVARDGHGPIPAIGLRGARHFPMVEQPTVFGRLLIDFLEAPDVASLTVRQTWERRVR